MTKTKCPICASHKSPHRMGEPLVGLKTALAVLGLVGSRAHPSCLRLVVNSRLRRARRLGLSTPLPDAPLSAKLEALRFAQQKGLPS